MLPANSRGRQSVVRCWDSILQAAALIVAPRESSCVFGWGWTMCIDIGLDFRPICDSCQQGYRRDVTLLRVARTTPERRGERLLGNTPQKYFDTTRWYSFHGGLTAMMVEMQAQLAAVCGCGFVPLAAHRDKVVRRESCACVNTYLLGNTRVSDFPVLTPKT